MKPKHPFPVLKYGAMLRKQGREQTQGLKRLEGRKTIRKMKTLNLTPTWESILPALLAVIENGSYKSRKEAMAELKRMAQIADSAVRAEQNPVS